MHFQLHQSRYVLISRTNTLAAFFGWIFSWRLGFCPIPQDREHDDSVRLVAKLAQNLYGLGRWEAVEQANHLDDGVLDLWREAAFVTIFAGYDLSSTVEAGRTFAIALITRKHSSVVRLQEATRGENERESWRMKRRSEQSYSDFSLSAFVASDRHANAGPLGPQRQICHHLNRPYYCYRGLLLFLVSNLLRSRGLQWYITTFHSAGRAGTKISHTHSRPRRYLFNGEERGECWKKNMALPPSICSLSVPHVIV